MCGVVVTAMAVVDMVMAHVADNMHAMAMAMVTMAVDIGGVVVTRVWKSLLTIDVQILFHKHSLP